MSIDWDAELLGPVMSVFGEGSPDDPSSWPTYYSKTGLTFRLEGAVYTANYRSLTDLADGSTEATYRPALGVRNAIFDQLGRVQPQQGDVVYLPSVGQQFAVANPQPDGVGHTLLILIEAA